MATTTNVTLTADQEYQKVADDGDQYVIENPSNTGKVQGVLSSSEPADTLRGHSIESKNGMSHSVFGENDVYVKGPINTVLVVTK